MPARLWIRLVAALLALGAAATPVWAQTAQLALAWTDNAADEEGFLLERRGAASSVFVQVALLGPNASGFIDASVARGAWYCYRVRAFNGAGPSAYTNEVCGTAAGTSPLPLSVTLNKATLTRAETLVATVNAVGGIVTSPIDAYVVIQTGAGFLSLQLDGRLVPGLVPIARGIVLPTIAAPFSFPLAGAPPGAYTWLAAVTSPGSLTLVAPLASTPFAIVP